MEQLLKLLSVFGAPNGIDASTNDRDLGLGECPGKIQRRLPTKLDNHSIGLNLFANIEHVFDGEWFKEE